MTPSAIRARRPTELAVALAVAAVVAVLVPVARAASGLYGLLVLTGLSPSVGVGGLLAIAATVLCFAAAVVVPGRMPWSVRVGAIAGMVAGAAILMLMGALGLLTGGEDARVFYEHRLPDPYDAPYLQYGFVYAPPVAQLLYPFVQLEWQMFLGLWTAALVIALTLVAGPASPILILAPLIAFDLHVGNVNLLIALAVASGLARPAWWSLVLFTKITPAVGLGWFVMVHRWRDLAVALGVTGAIAAVSAILAPSLWLDWIHTLTQIRTLIGAPDTSTLLVRLVLAATIVAWGGLTDRPWTVGLAAFVAVPITWPTTASILVAVVGLAQARRVTQGSGSTEGSPRRPLGLLEWLR